MARAWLDASLDLGVRVVHPFSFVTKSGIHATTVGVYVPDFGGPRGTLLMCRFDSDEVAELVWDTDYFTSGLNPRSYEPYKRKLYQQTLSDWGWYARDVPPPPWYEPNWRAKER